MADALWDLRTQPSPGRDAVVVGVWAPVSPLDLTVQRRLLGDALRGFGDTPGVVDGLLLVFEELVSNALRHGRPPVRAALTAFDGYWLLEVSDASPDLPPTPDVGRDPAEGGLGLPLVYRISGSCGWQTDGDRKTVWALLDRMADGRERRP